MSPFPVERGLRLSTYQDEIIQDFNGVAKNLIFVILKGSLQLLAAATTTTANIPMG